MIVAAQLIPRLIASVRRAAARMDSRLMDSPASLRRSIAASPVLLMARVDVVSSIAMGSQAVHAASAKGLAPRKVARPKTAAATATIPAATAVAVACLLSAIQAAMAAQSAVMLIVQASPGALSTGRNTAAETMNPKIGRVHANFCAHGRGFHRAIPIARRVRTVAVTTLVIRPEFHASTTCPPADEPCPKPSPARLLPHTPLSATRPTNVIVANMVASSPSVRVVPDHANWEAPMVLRISAMMSSTNGAWAASARCDR